MLTTKEVNGFIATVRATEYRFDTEEERVMFITGYNRGKAGLDLLSRIRQHKLGYQVGQSTSKGFK